MDNNSLPRIGHEVKLKKIDGELSRVIEFSPIASIKDGELHAPPVPSPYGILVVEYGKMPHKKLKWLVAHKTDFMHLWEIFKERGVKESEEVLIEYDSRRRKILTKLLFWCMPQMHFYIYPKGFFESLYYRGNHQRSSEEIFEDLEKYECIQEWKPFPHESRLMYV